MVTQVPASTATTSSWPFSSRHISPRPPRKNQISSTVLCATAIDVSPGGSSKWARPPRPSCNRIRTSDPSGATASRATGRRVVLKLLTSLVSSWPAPLQTASAPGHRDRRRAASRCDRDRPDDVPVQRGDRLAVRVDHAESQLARAVDELEVVRSIPLRRFTRRELHADVTGVDARDPEELPHLGEGVVGQPAPDGREPVVLDLATGGTPQARLRVDGVTISGSGHEERDEPLRAVIGRRPQIDGAIV